MGCFKKKKAASSLAPSDKYHKNPQGGHRHIAHQASSRGGGGEPSSAPLNNSQFSHNGHTTATTVQLHPYPQDDDQVLVDSGVGSPYHFYPSSSVGSLSSSQQHQHQSQSHPQPAPPYLLYKSNQSCGSSGNGSQSIIEGSNANGGGVDLSSGAKYYYYNGLYYPTEEENPDQIFTITANPVQGRMGRVGEDMYPPGSPGGGGGVGSGLFKSKSGSLPVTSSPRGFRDTFISSMSPAPAHAHSAESSPLHRSSSAVTGNDRYINASANGGGGGGGKQENSNKKWTFGGLFRRNKSKNAQQINHHHDSERFENGASVYSNSATNSPGKINNNYGVATLGGSSVVISESRASPAPSSSIGVISVDPSGHSETNYHRNNTNTTPKFVNAEVQTRAKGKLSESDISTCDSDFEQFPHQSHHDNPPEPAPQESKGGSGGGGYKQNFLVRRLSRRREKAAAKKKAALEAQAQVSTSASNLHNNNSSTNGFHSSHHHGGPSHLDHHHHPQMTRRVGSSPDSLNNSTSEQQSHIFPSWETTKKPQSQLHALQQHQQRLQNYSSNGSLSLSQEGSSNNTNHFSNGSRSSRAAAKDAVKARAIARRESFLRDSSSSGEEEDDDNEDQRSRNSLQGSFSSLNSRNRRQKAFNMQQVQFQQQRHLFPATTGASAGGAGAISCASPSSPMPVPLDYRNNMSPNMNRRLMAGGAAPPPGSPKWEARLVYQQENITESNQPVVFRLPRKELQQRNQQPATTTTTTTTGQMSQNNGQDQSYIMATEMISEDQHVVTAGLKVPFVPSNPNSHQDQQCLMRNGQLMYQPDEPAQQYANVANGSRGRSATPFTTFPSNGNNPGPSPIHHASPTPPPPPRRDFSSSSRSSANNTNFYRPVSCSYLDAYASQLQNQHLQNQQLSEQQQLQLQMMRQQNPMIFNGNYIYPQQQQHQYQGQDVMNGFPSHGAGTRNVSSEAIRSSPRHLVAAASVHNANIISSASPSQEVNLHHRHPPLIRSPSEPPAIRVEQAAQVRNSTSSPRKRLTFSPTVGYEDDQGEGENKNVVTSKLGFPVRRLQDSNKLTGPQSPIHMKASEFWRKKESEVTGTSPVGNNQKKYLSRIRSADSSPLPVPKMRKSPGVIAASNESISSLSSFSENAASPGPPKNSSSPIHGKQKGGGGGVSSGLVKVTPLRAQLSKTPNPQQLTYGNNTDKENNNNSHQSAVERLKVRIPSAPDGIKTSSHPHPYHHPEHNNNSSNPIRALIDLNNGKTPGKNLEDALNELEDMYKSLRLSDEDLLDRAERRDLPTPHQELRDAPLIPIPQGYRFEHLGSVESLGTGSGSSGTNNTGEHRDVNRVRAPPMRRSSRPDTVSDDMANRRLAFPDGKPMDPRLMVAKAGSYIAKSPAFSPCTSPCPPDIHHMSSSFYPLAALFGQDEPDLTLDDVTFRNYKRANSIRIIEPQPPFGIPLGPITAAAATDYLHSEPNESYRPIFGNLKTPDVVNDDIAFRNLRKDLGQESGLSGTNKDWTPRLFSPNRESSFNFPKVKDSKKLRAIRSLSANITHMMPTSGGGGGGGAGGVRGESPTSFYRDKWSSFSDLHRRASAGSPARASTYLQPSWVEQIEKVQTSTETLTDHRNSSGRLSSAILDPPEHWERKFPKKTVELTPPIYDPEKPRRPWTDIILESFEKEKEREMERIAAEAEAAAAAAAADSNNTTEQQKSGELLEDEVGDDDVFMDASADEVVARSKSEAAQQRRSKSEISGESNDPDRNGSSLQATPPNMEKTKSSAVIFPPRPLPLLPGQNTRRGSWVESSSSSSQSELQGNQSGGEGYFLDKRRKSWSDLPKDIDSFCSRGAITLSGQSSSSPTRKLFNPLPPPKKIRQINLGAFNNNSSSSTNNSGGNDDDELTSSTTSPDKVKIRGEDELNELMDQLLKDADTCGHSKSPQPKSGHFAKSAEPAAASVESSSHSTSSPPPVDVRCSEKEMKMDGIASSSSPSSSTTTPSCKQDLSCTIVGIIPKQQSPQKSPQQQEGNSSQPKRETSNSQLDQPTFSQEKQTTSTLSTTTAQLTSEKKGAGDSTSRKLFKIDNNGMGNVAVSSLPSETSKKRASPSSAEPLLLDVVDTNNKRKGEPSSIEDLIESINETLPELEAGIGITITKHHDEDEVDDDGKSNGSSSSSSVNGSPSSSIPSPHPSSPTPPRVLSVNVKKEVTDAFPVPAKRHHLPTGKGEESLYENLPVRSKKSTGNEVSSSDPHCHQRQEDPPTATTKEIPPLDEEDNEHSSSHQPSSLSSNDSEVSGTVQREDEPNKSNESVATHSSPPNPSSSFDNKPLTKTSSSDAFPETKDDDARRAQAAKAALLRKKSEAGRKPETEEMMKNTRRSTRRESRSSRLSRSKSAAAILLDFLESRERRKEHEQHDHQHPEGGKGNHPLNPSNLEMEKRGKWRSTTELNSSTSTPPKLHSDLQRSESCSTFPELCLGESSGESLGMSSHNGVNGGMLSKRARRARMFQLSTPEESCHQQKRTPSEILAKEEKWEKIIEIMESKTDESMGKEECGNGSSLSCDDDDENDAVSSTETIVSGYDGLSTSSEVGEDDDEGLSYPPGNSIERVDQASRTWSPHSSTKEEIVSPPVPNGESCGKELGQRSASSSASPAPTEGTPEKKKEEAPVAPPVPTNSSTFSGRKCSGTAPSAADASASETSTGMSFLRNNFPFFRNSTSRSRSQSVVSDISRSSETGDSKKEKDKSYRRKSHLNRAFTDEPVPDNGFPFDFTPKSSKPTSQEVSSLENSAMEEGRTLKPAVKLHPAIPPVLTATKSRSPSSKPVSRTNSINRNNEHTPSPTLTATSSTAAGNRKGTPVVKKDSFSDAEGVCFIKKMLQKESDRDRAAAALGGKQNSSGGPSVSSCSSAAGYNLKKSPSAGNQSYWSKFSSSQSAFLRKLFDKPKTGGESSSQPAPKKDSSSAEEGHKQSGESPEKDSSEKENAEPMVGFSVAQKASFFMKLEHEQRFSKWRKNSVDLGSGAELEQQQQRQSAAPVSGSGAREFRPRSRYLTQPVTPTEVKEIAPLVNCFTPSLNSERDNQERILEFGSQPRIWSSKGFGNSMGNCVTDSSEKIKSGETSSKPTKSSYKDYDDTHTVEPTIVATSLKERVNKFDEIIIRKVAPIQVSAPSPSPNAKSYSLTRNNRNASIQVDNLGGYPMYHSASAIINSTGPKNHPVLNVNKSSTNFYKNSATAYSSSSSSFSEAMSKNDSTKFLPLSASNLKHRNHQAIFENENKRCGSASDLELAGTANQSPVLTRSEKVQSMYLSRSGYRCDADNLSEDGEVSSGGQEVAEIICRSYENSPVFRKKNWRSQQKQSHSNFTKEIWRRCGNYENWNQTQRSSFTKPLQQRQQPQHPVPQTFTTTTNVIEVNTTAPITLIQAAPSPPATSNLLQILTVLSSSNDELSESKPNPTKSKKQRQGHKLVSSSSSSIPPVHPGHPSNNHSTSTSSAEPKLNTATSPPKMPPIPGSEIFVSVPHPEDEAFQSFFCSVKSYTQVTHYPGGGVNNGQVQQRFGTPAIVDEEAGGGAPLNNCTQQMPSTSSEGMDIGSVRRESDLLVMKKNMPTAKRKSNGKYKNPLRALAARMDFRQQGYTQIHNNTVQQSSDVDVTT